MCAGLRVSFRFRGPRELQEGQSSECPSGRPRVEGGRGWKRSL